MGSHGAKDMKKRLSNAVTTLVGADAEISGNVSFNQGCHVAGVVTGDVIAASDDKSEVSVAQGARVEGNVEAASVLIQGTVVGDLRCHGKLTLTASARIEGSIEFGQIRIEKGAKVKGSLVMIPEGSPAQAAASPSHQKRAESATEVRAVQARV